MLDIGGVELWIKADENGILLRRFDVFKVYQRNRLVFDFDFCFGIVVHHHLKAINERRFRSTACWSSDLAYFDAAFFAFVVAVQPLADFSTGIANLSG